MNTIKIYLAESGRIADLKKDFPLYQGQFQNKLLNIYVPTSILAPNFTSQDTNGSISEFTASTGVKIGMTHLTSSGTVKTSQNYYMRYLKTLTYQNVEYALYERKLPKEFTTYAGQGENAPILVANVVNIQLDTEGGTPEVLSIITTQQCRLDVMPSSLLDKDEAVEPSELELLNANLNEVIEQLEQKQDKEDNRLETTNKTVVGAINENKSNIDVNRTNIASNAEEISNNRDEINSLKETSLMGTTYIGQLSGDVLPTETRLNSFVYSQTSPNRNPQVGDVVFFVLELPNETDQIYKYTYFAGGWAEYLIPNLEVARNGSLGIVKGTFGVSNNSTIVDISGGEIIAIYVKDDTDAYRNIQEYANTLKTSILDIVNGNTSVGVALRSIADALGNNIVNTYMTINAGATKQYVRDYALPREFNDVYYITRDGYSKTPPTFDSGKEFLTYVSSVGVYYDVFTLEQEVTADFQLSNKNSYRDVIYMSADIDTTLSFVLTTQYKKVGADWADLNVELTSQISFTADNIQKVEFSSSMNSLGDKVVTLTSGDMIRQKLEVLCLSGAGFNLSVYSNSVYPSVFNLNTQSQTLTIQKGDLGQEPVYDLTGTYSAETNTLNFTIPSNVVVNKDTDCLFILRYPNNDISNLETTKMTLTWGEETIRLVTPYNKTEGDVIVPEMVQTINAFSPYDGYKWYFKGFVTTVGTDTEVLVEVDTIKRDYDFVITNQEEFDHFVDNSSAYYGARIFLATNWVGSTAIPYMLNKTIVLNGSTLEGDSTTLNKKTSISIYDTAIGISAETYSVIKNIYINSTQSPTQGENNFVIKGNEYESGIVENCIIDVSDNGDGSLIIIGYMSAKNTDINATHISTIYGFLGYNLSKNNPEIENCSINLSCLNDSSSFAYGGFDVQYVKNTTINISGKTNQASAIYIYTNDVIEQFKGVVNCSISVSSKFQTYGIQNAKNISNSKISVGSSSGSAIAISNSSLISNCEISATGSVSGYALSDVHYVSNCKTGESGVTTAFIDTSKNNSYIDSETVEGAESYSNLGKTLLLGADGIIESERVVFTVQNAESYMPYRTNLRSFMTDFSLPLVGTLDQNLKVAITFGDTTYNLYDIMKGTDEAISIGDLVSVSRYSTETGYRFFPEIAFFETSSITGFTIMPTNITSSQLEKIMGESDGVALCALISNYNEDYRDYQIGEMATIFVDYNFFVGKLKTNGLLFTYGATVGQVGSGEGITYRDGILQIWKVISFNGENDPNPQVMLLSTAYRPYELLRTVGNANTSLRNELTALTDELSQKVDKASSVYDLLIEGSPNKLYVTEGNTIGDVVASVDTATQIITLNGNPTSPTSVNNNRMASIQPLTCKSGETWTFTMTVLGGEGTLGTIKIVNEAEGMWANVISFSSTTLTQTKTFTADKTYDAISFGFPQSTTFVDLKLGFLAVRGSTAPEWQPAGETFKYKADIDELKEKVEELENGGGSSSVSLYRHCVTIRNNNGVYNTKFNFDFISTQETFNTSLINNKMFSGSGFMEYIQEGGKNLNLANVITFSNATSYNAETGELTVESVSTEFYDITTSSEASGTVAENYCIAWVTTYAI